MSDIDDIVGVDIVVQDTVPDAPSFDTALLCGYHTAWVDDLVRDYDTAADMLTDGFLVTDDLYLMMQAFKSQPNAPQTVKIGRLTHVYTQVIELVPTSATQGFVYKGGSVGGLSWTYTVPGSATIASVCTAIAALINGLTAGTTATGASGTKIVCTAGTPGKLISFVPGKGINLLDVTADAGLAAELAAIAAEDNAWYAMAIAPQSRVYVKAAGAYAEANGKIFIGKTADWNAADASVTSGDVGTELVTLAYTRTAVMWHGYVAGTEWIDAAWLSSILSFEPGNATAAFKTLAGISADKLSAGQKAGIKTKRLSRYMPQGGLNITFEGRTPSKRFIDVTRFVDWLRATMQLAVFTVLYQNPKVAYDRGGFSLVEGAMLDTLKRGQREPNNGLTTDVDPVVTILPPSEQAVADRADRIMRSAKFTGRLSGALHGVNISGTLSV
ncbi:MAG TPA: DUF3383 family protein [Polyangiaceae bacterium]|nr:DUF3383 family protein [Polyangiaceae bacterium]